jgi:hypothetical protein
MKLKTILIVAVLAVALLGCGKQQAKHIVILTDVSGSIDRQSLEQAFKAIDELANHLYRGDRLTIIPILSDAEAEASGKILRFEVPKVRGAYDADLRGFQAKLNISLAQVWNNATTHPGSKTDILGSVALAEQEFRLGAGQSKQTLIILSDFIQEDTDRNFRTNKQLSSPNMAMKFGLQTASRNALSIKNTPVYLGLLRSNEYSTLMLNRRAGIQAFWIKYFETIGGTPQFAADGISLLRADNFK